MINGNVVGSYSHLGKTLTIVDENGTEIIGVITENEEKFTATDNDVREGAVYASDGGISVGTKDIPSYHTTEGYKLTPAGSKFSISLPKLDKYDYTKFQAIICPYNSSIIDSVASEKISIENKVYEVSSTNELTVVTKDSINKTIELGITNTSSIPYVIRYFTYKEID